MSSLNLYDAVRAEIQTGDWIGWRSPTIVGWGIRFWQRVRYNLKDSDNHESIIQKTKRVNILEALGKGLTRRLLSERLLLFKGEAYWYKLKPLYEPLRPYIGEIINRVIDRMEEEQVEYDFIACLSNFWCRANKDAKDYYCSEIAYMVIEEAAKRYYDDVGGADPAKEIMKGILRANEYLSNKAPTPGDTPHLGLFEEKVRIL